MQLFKYKLWLKSFFRLTSFWRFVIRMQEFYLSAKQSLHMNYYSNNRITLEQVKIYGFIIFTFFSKVVITIRITKSSFIKIIKFFILLFYVLYFVTKSVGSRCHTFGYPLFSNERATSRLGGPKMISTGGLARSVLKKVRSIAEVCGRKKQIIKLKYVCVINSVHHPLLYGQGVLSTIEKELVFIKITFVSFPT